MKGNQGSIISSLIPLAGDMWGPLWPRGWVVTARLPAIKVPFFPLFPGKITSVCKYPIFITLSSTHSRISEDSCLKQYHHGIWHMMMSFMNSLEFLAKKGFPCPICLANKSCVSVWTQGICFRPWTGTWHCHHLFCHRNNRKARHTSNLACPNQGKKWPTSSSHLPVNYSTSYFYSHHFLSTQNNQGVFVRFQVGFWDDTDAHGTQKSRGLLRICAKEPSSGPAGPGVKCASQLKKRSEKIRNARGPNCHTH